MRRKYWLEGTGLRTHTFTRITICIYISLWIFPSSDPSTGHYLFADGPRRIGNTPVQGHVHICNRLDIHIFATGLLHFQKALWGATSSPSSSGKGPATRMGFCPALNTVRHGRLIVGLFLLAPVSFFNVVSSTP
jgi:hypothetical protein